MRRISIGRGIMSRWLRVMRSFPPCSAGWKSSGACAFCASRCGKRWWRFILSSNNNAVRIRQLVWKVCALGPQMEIDGAPMRGFPAPEVLARAGADALRQMGCGYRAEYLEQTARRVADGFGLEALRAMEYGAARERLLQLSGVGPKVADCVLLFGCGHTQAFPVDVWMARAMEKYFGMGGLSRERMREGAPGNFRQRRRLGTAVHFPRHAHGAGGNEWPVSGR